MAAGSVGPTKARHDWLSDGMLTPPLLAIHLSKIQQHTVQEVWREIYWLSILFLRLEFSAEEEMEGKEGEVVELDACLVIIQRSSTLLESCGVDNRVLKRYRRNILNIY